MVNSKTLEIPPNYRRDYDFDQRGPLIRTPWKWRLYQKAHGTRGSRNDYRGSTP